MGTVQKGILTRSPEWAKHLRPRSKRQFWRHERLAEHELARKEAADVASPRKSSREKSPNNVMPGLVPGIHVFARHSWMAGTSPAMTIKN